MKDMKTTSADEQTKVIPQPLANPQNIQPPMPAPMVNRPAPMPANVVNRPTPMPAPAPVKPAAPAAINPLAAPLKPPFSSLFPGSSEDKQPQKRRIVPGLLIGGALAGLGIIGLTSLIPGPTPDVAPVVDGNQASDTSSTSPAVVTTTHPVSDVIADDLPLEDAREIARAEVGSLGLFKHQGVIHTTTTEEEIAAMAPEEVEAFLGGLNVAPVVNATVEESLDINPVEVEIPLMEDVFKVTKHPDGTFYLLDKSGNSEFLENVSEDAYGQMVRTDPETGEITAFHPTAILTDVNNGVVDISIYPSDVEIAYNGEIILGNEPVEPIMHDYYNYTIYDSETGSYSDLTSQEDPYADTLDYSESVTTEETVSEPELLSESEMLNIKLGEIAKSAGIDDLRKIKVRETDEGYKIKIKGEDGEKVKTFLSKEELASSAEEYAQENSTQSTEEHYHVHFHGNESGQDYTDRSGSMSSNLYEDGSGYQDDINPGMSQSYEI